MNRPIKVEVGPELLELVSEEEDTWRNSLSPEELAQYAGKYIATRRKGVAAVSETLANLYRTLDAMGLRGRVCIEYVEAPDAVVIY